MTDTHDEAKAAWFEAHRAVPGQGKKFSTWFSADQLDYMAERGLEPAMVIKRGISAGTEGGGLPEVPPEMRRTLLLVGQVAQALAAGARLFRPADEEEDAAWDEASAGEGEG